MDLYIFLNILVNMIVTIHQPNYLPWIGFFHKVLLSDTFVILDDAEYSKNGFINRNKIKTPNGGIWLTLPAQAKEHELISEVKLATNIRWAKKHWQAIENNYSNCHYFAKYSDYFKEIFEKDWSFLSELNIELIGAILKILDIKSKIVRSSELEIKTKRTQRLVDICKKLDAKVYIAGQGGKDYLNEGLFKKNNVKLVYQEFEHPKYPQKFGEFEPYMSVIDLIFNCGPESKKIILASGEKKEDIKIRY